ncbi:nitroreductase family protein [Paenibacillus thalictri]|uniref:Nitroreductase family protein n=1 Tax=Paenibacillus thalictri TaxID=2527873 RepID=A0A4V2J4L9_9BACL|nr:nitroreductase family protein [Paenibacillus thalictri]TBL80351.1 nitroreductase family protein [Paenibacillus thalictri]
MLPTTATSTVAEAMTERHSVKKFEKGRQIPESTLTGLLQLAHTAPSSWNLQHWKFIVIEDQSVKDNVLPIAFHQSQVSDCSALIVVLADLEANLNAEEIYSDAVKQGLMSEEVKQTLKSQVNNAYERPNVGLIEGYKNSSFAAMQLMLAAKGYGLDSCPMGGFDQQKLVDTLHIPSRYAPSLLIAIGYASEPAYRSTRMELDKVIVRNAFW